VGDLKFDADTAPDLNFTIQMELLPEIAIPDLSTVLLTRLRAEVAAEAVHDALSNIAKSRATKNAVTEERAAVFGDVLTVDFAGTQGGVAFEGGTGTDADVEIGGTGYIPGFAEGMEGMVVGETRDVNVTFPESYHAIELAGKDAVFNVTAKALSVREPAVVDDALADALGLGTLDELRDYVTKTLQRELDQTARLHLKRDLLDSLAELAIFPTPGNLLDAEFGAIWQRIEADLATGQLDEEDRGKDAEVLKDEYRAIAERRVRLGLLLAEIGRVNQIDVTEQELSRALQAEMQKYPGQENQVLDFFRKNQGAVAQLRGPIFEDKVVDYILSIAKIEDKLVSVEELNRPMEGLPGTAKAAVAEEAAADAVAEPAPEAGVEAVAEAAAEKPAKVAKPKAPKAPKAAKVEATAEEIEPPAQSE